jgi:hypothetical protein
MDDHHQPGGQLIQGTGTLAGGDFTACASGGCHVGRLTTYNNGVVQVDINTQGR